MRRPLPLVLAALFVVGACSSTEPNGALRGCYVLETSALSNGTPPSKGFVRVDGETAYLLTTRGVPESAVGAVHLEANGTLTLWFGGGLAGVTYTFPSRVDGQWVGTVLFWVDTPVLNGRGSAKMTPAPCLPERIV